MKNLEDGDHAAKIVSFPSDLEQSCTLLSPEKFEEEDNVSSSREPLRRFQDDASLYLPSSLIRFRANDSTARVYPDERGQFIIEETFIDNDDKQGKTKVVNAKWIETSNVSIKILRASYTLVAAFFTGFILVVALELLLYVILDLTIESGVTNKSEVHLFSALGVFLAFPLYIYGLTGALVISWFFVTDAWNGHLLVKLFGFGNKAVLIAEWYTFFLYFGIPIMTMIGTILGGVENWWTITSLVWFICMSIAFFIFGAIILLYEFRANWEVTRNRFDDDDDRWFCLMNRAIQLRQRHLYGGVERSTYLLRGTMDNFTNSLKGGHQQSKTVSNVISKGKTLYCRIVSWKIWEKMGMFEHLEEPEVQYTIDDAQNLRGYMTAHTWSLETVFCRPRHSRYIVVLGGKQALTTPQIRSSVVCAIFGNIIGILSLIALLKFLNAPAAVCAIIVVLVCVFILYPSIAQSYRITKMTKSIKKLSLFDKKLKAITGSSTDDDDSFVLEHNESEGMFQVWERKRIVTLTSNFCWVLFILEVIFLFLYPLVAIIRIGNVLMGMIFMIVSITSFVRSYFNAAIVIEETGKMDLVDGEKGSLYHWQNMSRLNTIVGKVTRSPAKSIWTGVLITLLLVFVSMGTMTVASEATLGSNRFLTYLPEFEYEQQNDVPYPTCSSEGNFNKRSDTNRETHQLRSMADYSFLASLAYANDNITQRELDQWFNESGVLAVFDHTAVSTFRQTDITTDVTPVVYRLIKFPSEKEAIVVIRGSTDPVDFMVDGQLWMGAGLFQVLRFIMPAGDIWTPIMHLLIQAINLLESESIRKISFYKETTRFIEWLQNSGEYNNIQATGHSLGGGLAMISGAQTGVAGIGISAPNTKLSRMAFNLTIDDLNTKTFNIVPERDVVPMVDDLAQNYQKIRCTANSGHFFEDTVECHGTGERTLCEFLYTCGTQNRPALCECVYNYGYPKPKPKEGFENLDFDEQCCAADNYWCGK